MKTLIALLLLLAVSNTATAEKIVPLLQDNAQVPTFMLPGLDNEQVSLRDFCGQPRLPRKNRRYITILSFMASYCIPCRHEIPQLEEYAKTAGDDVKVLFISIDSAGKEVVTAFRQQMKMEQQILHDQYGTALKKYGVKYLPSIFIIDKGGILRYQNLEGLPPGLNLIEVIKEKVAAIRNSANPPPPPPTQDAQSQGQKKLTAINLLLSGRSEESVLRETGLSPEDLDRLKAEVQSVMKARWGLE